MESEDGNALAEAITTMDKTGAWNFESKVKQILSKLNIEHLQKPAKHFKRWSAKKSSSR